MQQKPISCKDNQDEGSRQNSPVIRSGVIRNLQKVDDIDEIQRRQGLSESFVQSEIRGKRKA